MMTVETIASSAQPILILDYDGTLAPFVVDRDKAFPYPGVLERLETILAETDTRLVIMSGRTIKDLTPLIKLNTPVELWGCHGIERMLPDGSYNRIALPEGAQEALDQAKTLCKLHLPSQTYEVKPTSIAVHTRGGSKNIVEEEILPAFEEIAFASPLEVHPFDGGIELRPDHVDKGTAVKTLLDEVGDCAIAYLGDDFTDEDAFEALGDRGLKVLVKKEARPTRADMTLTPPEELLKFLDKWIEHGRA